MTRERHLCDATRSAFLQPLPSGRSACVLAVGHRGRHRDVTGGTWIVTPEVAEAVAVCLASDAIRQVTGRHRDGSSEIPYVSPRCVLGTHPWCDDGEARTASVPGVRYLLCACPCHRSTAPQGGRA
jgi:hypothetical protein